MAPLQAQASCRCLTPIMRIPCSRLAVRTCRMLWAKSLMYSCRPSNAGSSQCLFPVGLSFHHRRKCTMPPFSPVFFCSISGRRTANSCSSLRDRNYDKRQVMVAARQTQLVHNARVARVSRVRRRTALTLFKSSSLCTRLIFSSSCSCTSGFSSIYTGS